jgi:chromatin remodeling complex protein RSC6
MSTHEPSDSMEATHEPVCIGDQFSNILSTLSQFKSQITLITTQLKSLEKTVNREVKHQKKGTASKQVKLNRKPSGFAAAAPISKDLCEFMGKDVGTSIARTEVTKFICSYIKDHSLTDDDNNKVIKPDDKLKSLLGTNDDTVLTYFNIQRFMNKHFLKDSVQSK